MDKDTQTFYEGMKSELEHLIDNEGRMIAYYSEKVRDANQTIDALEKELEKVKKKLNAI